MPVAVACCQVGQLEEENLKNQQPVFQNTYAKQNCSPQFVYMSSHLRSGFTLSLFLSFVSSVFIVGPISLTNFSWLNSL